MTDKKPSLAAVRRAQAVLEQAGLKVLGKRKLVPRLKAEVRERLLAVLAAKGRAVVTFNKKITVFTWEGYHARCNAKRLEKTP